MSISKSIFMPDYLSKTFFERVLKKYSNYASGSLLDVGCGNKPYKMYFDNYVNSYVGIDIRSNNADIKDDFMYHNFKKLKFNTVLCTQVLEHVSDPDKFLQKIGYLLKNKGILIISVPFAGSIHEKPFDYYRYTEFGIKYLLNKNKFKVKEIVREGNSIDTIIYILNFYLESTANIPVIKQIKRIFIALNQCLSIIISKVLPARLLKTTDYPINYFILAIKE